MNIQNTVEIWVLSRLFKDDNVSYTSKHFMRDLCAGSIGIMGKPEDLHDALSSLEKEGLVEKDAGHSYSITEKGLFVYRKEVVGAIQKRAKKVIGLNFTSIAQKYPEFIKTADRTSELAKNVAELCIKNAPLVIAFFKEVSL